MNERMHKWKRPINRPIFFSAKFGFDFNNKTTDPNNDYCRFPNIYTQNAFQIGIENEQKLSKIPKLTQEKQM